MRASALVATALWAGFWAPEAQALCIYHGVLYAKPTLGQEFLDSKWVIRAKVLSAQDHYSDAKDPWTTYGIAVQQVFKGNPPKGLVFFTFRNSGGFYLDNGMSHNIGGDYLLFLNSGEPSEGDPAAMRGTVSANYSCGQSKDWRDVSASDLEALKSLSSRH